MKRAFEIVCFCFLMSMLYSCTEDIVIDVEEGEPMVGIDATFTDQLKCHEAILSYTTDFYNAGDIRMVRGARVYLYALDGVDTIYYHEDEERPGHYLTDSVAGERNKVYRLCVDITEEDGSLLQLFSESYIPNNVDCIDSLVIKPFNGANDSIPTVMFGDTIEWLYPYFQSLPDPNIYYMPMVSKNDTLVTDSLNKRMMMSGGGYAGYYVNGPEMQQANKEIPLYYFRKSNLRPGDRIRAELYSIPPDYMSFIYSILMSSGSNPMLGAPANVNTNIQPHGKGVGWFLTASVVSAETVFNEHKGRTMNIKQ